MASTSLPSPSVRGGAFGFIKWAVIIAVGAILLFAISPSPFFSVNEGDRAVVLRFGRAVRVADPGLNFKIPIIDSVVPISVRTEKRLYENQSSYSRDVQEGSVTLSVNYHVREDKVLEVYSRYGTAYAERALDPIVPKRLKEVFGQFQAATVVSDRVKLGLDLDKAIEDGVPTDLFVVEGVQIQNIDFSDAYEQAIEAAAQAEAAVRRSRNELDREKIEAEKRLVSAQAAADSLRAAAQAEADGIRLRGEAEARTIEAKAKAFFDNPGYVNLIAAEKWNGVLPTTQVPGSAVPFISLPTGGTGSTAAR